MLPATRFSDPLAVEAWDARFRWRDGDQLRDATIEDTWWRVADAIAAPNGESAPLWSYHYALAFSQWRLLPDERLLQAAGTSVAIDHARPFSAVLNAAAFVSMPFGSQPRFERLAFIDTAALAVHLLDDALLACDGTQRGGLRIGILGLGDAMQKLQVDFASPGACIRAREFAIALAEGCLRGGVDLAQERGAANPVTPRQLEQWKLRGMPPRLVERASRLGVRHLVRTAIERHPTLAMLANNTTDAFDQCCPAAGNLVQSEEDPMARRQIGAAMQPWIDLPIASSICNPASLDSGHLAGDIAGHPSPGPT